LDAGVKHGVPPIGRDVPRVWLFAMPHHHRDLAAEVLLVEAERLLAVPTVVEIDVEFHINRDSTRPGSMNERDLTRRSFVQRSLAAAGPAMVAALPLELQPAGPGVARMTVVCVGGHPDDPESGCGGTLTRYAALGHAVTVVYLTRGERGISGKSLDEAAMIGTAECEAAGKNRVAKPGFFGQTDGRTGVMGQHGQG